jgi:hypothetical protein
LIPRSDMLRTRLSILALHKPWNTRSDAFMPNQLAPVNQTDLPDESTIWLPEVVSQSSLDGTVVGSTPQAQPPLPPEELLLEDELELLELELLEEDELELLLEELELEELLELELLLEDDELLDELEELLDEEELLELDELDEELLLEAVSPAQVGATKLPS